MRSVVSLFLVGFLLDAALSVASSWLPAPAPLRPIVGWIVLAGAVSIYAAMAFDRRLPKRLLLPPTLFVIWTGLCGGFPLAFLLPGDAPRFLGWAQLVLAVGLLLEHLRPSSSRDGPIFSWKNLAIFTVATVAALPFVLAAAAVNALGTGMESSTGGYLKLRPSGLLLEERELAKDGKRVRLVSMMHIGAREYYENVQASLPANGRAIVLLEGISDDKDLLKSRFSYSKIARMLGLAAQESSPLQRSAPARTGGNDSPAPPVGKLEYRRADLDVSAFRPTTIRYINAVGGLFENPTLDTLVHALRDDDSPLGYPGIDQIVMNDILNKRNAHLVDAINAALRTHETLIVPWGALHLPFIEDTLKKQGFQETNRVDRPVVRF